MTDTQPASILWNQLAPRIQQKPLTALRAFLESSSSLNAFSSLYLQRQEAWDRDLRYTTFSKRGKPGCQLIILLYWVGKSCLWSIERKTPRAWNCFHYVC